MRKHGLSKINHATTALASMLFILLSNSGIGLAATNQAGCNDSSDAGIEKCVHNNVIVQDLNKIVAFLSVGAGVIIIGMLIAGGIQYIAAGDNSSATADAKKRIINAFIALAIFLFAFAFLQWLIPGGI